VPAGAVKNSSAIPFARDPYTRNGGACLMNTFTAVVVCTCLSTIGPAQTVQIGAHEKMTLKASEVYWVEATSNKKLELPIQLPEIRTLLRSMRAAPEVPLYRNR
jgi:hypothetical protein